MPGLLIERRTRKSFVFVGNQTMCSSDDIKLGFLAFLSAFYVLDVEYPNELAIPLTLFHKVVFLDNRCEESILDEFKQHWQELNSYFPNIGVNIA